MARKIKTSSGYGLMVRKVSPLALSELRERHNMNRKPFFTYKYEVEETKSSLEFVYTPPEEPPTLEDDPEGYSRYHQYLEWLEAFEDDMAKYRVARNKLVLGLSTKIVKGPSDWRGYYKSGDWINSLESAGIDVNDTNRKVLFLKVVVFDDDEYVKVIDLATVEEVTMGDVERAFDRFQYLLQRAATLAGDQALASRKDNSINDVLGIADSNGSGNPAEELVQDASTGTGSYGSD